jgi:tetratricopeptide (TPR) repeat protein
MNESNDPNRTVEYSSVTADSLDAGLAAGFGGGEPPRTSLGEPRPVLLKEADGESAHVVKPQSDAMPPPEQTGDRYQLQGEIARGGMGAVLRGRDVDLGRDLAVKVLLAKHANRPEVARRFIEEAQVGGQLQHPGVVPVYDLGRFGDRPFFTMKLVKGQTLAALLAARADHTQERPRLLGIAVQVCQTLAYAHAKGVIHRDLKPANIMVGAFGEVQVMDWGLAKVLAEGGVADEERASRSHSEPENATMIRTARSTGSTGSFGTVTEAGSLLGTPAYMAPEQANGDVALLDRRADVFGLGAILCEILTGKAPYVGRSSEEVRRKAANGDLADALARLDACGADQELIVLARACLSPESIDRPKDAQAVADALTTHLDGVQERLRGAELARAAETARAEEALHTAREANERARAERRARRFQVGLAASVLLLTTAGGLSATYVLRQREERASRLSQVLAETTVLRDKARREFVDPGLWRDALASLNRVEGHGPEPRTEAMKAEIEDGLDHAQRLAKLRHDLVEIRANQQDVGHEGTDAAYSAAFRAAQMDLDALEGADFAARWKLCPEAVLIEVAAFLDDWSNVRRQSNRPAAATHKLTDAARLIDLDPHRDRLRAMLNDGFRLDDLKAMATDAAAANVPAPTAVLLGRLLVQADLTDDGVALLRWAVGLHPNDVWVNFYLAQALDRLRPHAREEAARYYTAARALRPETAHPLAHLLERMGRGAEAEAIFRDLVDRRSADRSHLECLWNHLNERGRAEDAASILDQALAAAQEAVRVNPTDADAHLSLGTVLSLLGRKDEAIVAIREAIRFKPDDATALNQLGSILCDGKHDYPAAEEVFREALRLVPNYVNAQRNLGIVMEHLGRPDEAAACYHKSIELNPDNATGHYYLGKTLASQGRRDEAIDRYRQAIDLDPNLVKVRNDLGLALIDQNRLDEAIDVYRQAIEHAPSFFAAHNHLGTALRRKGRFNEAIDCHRKALELDPNSAYAQTNLGAALAETGRNDEAIACFRKALELDPELFQAHHNLGMALSAMGSLDDAIACFYKAIELEPDVELVHNQLGIALKRKGRLDEAIARFRRATELDPDDESAHNNLGSALKDAGRLDEAIACYHKALEINPKYITVLNNLGGALAAKGQVREAIACYHRAIELEPSDSEAHLNLGITLVGDGRLDEAIACYRQALALDPNRTVAHFNLGVALTSKGQLDEAAACFRRVIELDPKDAEAHYNLGVSLVNREQLDEAAACYRTAIELAPEFVKAQYGLASVLLAMGRLDEAVAGYEKTIELDPTRAEAHCNLGHALGRLGRFAESLAAFERGHALGVKQPGWPYPSDEWLRQAAARAALEARLPSLLNGELDPADNAQRIELVDVCHLKKLHYAAARFCADAFAAEPKLADDLQTGNRYNAACSAALAAAGLGNDAANLDDVVRTRLRKQALDWLRADLTAFTKQLESGPPAARNVVGQIVAHWQQDADLAGIRDKAALAKLPPDERAAWESLWGEVAALLKTVEAGPPSR